MTVEPGQASSLTIILIDRNGPKTRDAVEPIVRSAERTKHYVVSTRSAGSNPRRNEMAGFEWLRQRQLASGLNLAVKKVDTPYVALLPSDARPSEDWAPSALEMLESDPSLSAVRYRVKGIPYHGVSVTGLAGRQLPQPDRGEVLGISLYGTVVKVRHLRASGGFAALTDWNGIGTNLGWRLWLTGGSVRWCPDAIVEVLEEEPAESPGDLEAAVASVETCWDDRRRRSALEELEPRGRQLVAASARRWGTERERVQKLRRRSDPELLRLFDSVGGNPKLEKEFGPSRRVLVVTDDVLSQAMAGPSIRAWHISEELAKEHEVKLVTTTGICERKADPFDVEAPTGPRWTELEDWCEIVVHQGYALTKVPRLRGSKKIMIVDAYDPVQLEVLELAREDGEWVRLDAAENAVRVLNDQLRRADFVVCASSKQRDLWLGTLAAIGRVSPANYDADPTLERLINVVPFGLPTEPPRKSRSAIRGSVPGIGVNDQVVIWGGGLYNWFDPATLIRATDRLKEDLPNLRVFFMGGRHPNPLTPFMRTALEAEQLSERLGLTGKHVFFNEGWVDYEERQNYLLDADVGVSLHLDHVETAFSFRTRILDYIWAALPILATAGDAFAEIIERNGLGIVVAPQDVGATAEALRTILEQPALAARFRKASEELRPTLSWPEVMKPLAGFCRSPGHAADRIPPPGRPEPRDGLPSRLDRLRSKQLAATRRYRRGGAKSVVEGASNTVRRLIRGNSRQ